MPKCAVTTGYLKRCDASDSLTPIIFYNPITLSCEMLFPCQFHSNLVLGKYLVDYTELQREVKIEIRKKEQYFKATHDLGQQPEVPHLMRLEKLLENRENTAKRFCIDPECKKKLEDKIYPVFPIGQDGRIRHFMYLHKECQETLYRRLGGIKLIEAQQTTLP